MVRVMCTMLYSVRPTIQSHRMDMDAHTHTQTKSIQSMRIKRCKLSMGLARIGLFIDRWTTHTIVWSLCAHILWLILKYGQFSNDIMSTERMIHHLFQPSFKCTEQNWNSDNMNGRIKKLVHFVFILFFSGHFIYANFFALIF